MAAKYQVFVSSTYRDLSEERDLVIKAILEMGHIPVGMEMFSAADEEQWNVIKKQIDQSDYYIVIVAHRYGSCDAAGLSYTEKEYDYAVSKGVPTLGFVIDDNISWPMEKADTNPTLKAKLESLKEKVKTRPVSFWKNGDDLYGRCSIALGKAFNASPREGWVRASQAQDAAAAKEMMRLSAENADLRTRIQQFERAADVETAIDKVITTMRANTRKISVWKRDAKGWESDRDVTLYQLFEALAPEMQVELSLTETARYVATNVLRVPFEDLRKVWPTPRNTIRSLLADLSALECVVPSSKKKPVSDKDEYWCLSKFGLQLLAQMRRRRLERIESLAKVEQDDVDDKEIDA